MGRLLFTAERVGFEPTVRINAQRFSRPPDSTALAPLRGHTMKIKKPRLVTRTFIERETRLELATPTLARLCSTN